MPVRFHVPADVNGLSVNGRSYEPDADGVILCHSHEDHGPLRQLGCLSEDEQPVIGARVEPSEPPPVPEGMVSEEAVRALIEENEDQKAALTKLHLELEAAGQIIQELETRLAATERASGDAEDAGAASSASREEKASETAPAAKKGK